MELLPTHAAPELLYLESKWSSLVSYAEPVHDQEDSAMARVSSNPGAPGRYGDVGQPD